MIHFDLSIFFRWVVQPLVAHFPAPGILAMVGEKILDVRIAKFATTNEASFESRGRGGSRRVDHD